jgi:uncharacterized protein (TIGR03382 family)
MQYATRAAQAMGKPDDEARWSARSDEIRAAILANFVDPNGLLIGNRWARAWTLWPAGLYANGDPHVAAEADRMLDDLDAVASMQPPGSTYDGKLTSALAMVLQGDQQRLARLQGPLNTLLVKVPSSSASYGEVFIIADMDGDGVSEFDNRVAIPHLWEGSLNYLAAINYYGPRAPGCGCNASSTGPSAFTFALVLLLRSRRRSRRSGTNSKPQA